MSLSDLVSVTISTASRAVTQAGFGVPLILGYHSKFAELVRSYTSLAAMVADGFATTDPEYLAAQALEAQTPAPSRWMIGRRTHAPTQVIHLTPTAANAKIYTVTIHGVAYAFTSDADATVKEIVEGLKALIDAGAPANVTCTEDDTKLILTGAAGAFFRYEVSDNSGNPNGMALWTVKDASADGGIAADLAACLLESSDWYGLILTHQGEAEALAAAAWVESNKKLLVVASADTEFKTSATTDIASDVETASYARTAVMYHQKPHQFASAAWIGKLFPFDPGSETWKFKTLAGVDASVLTDAESGYIKAKHANWYQSIGGVAITQEGWSGSGEFIDVTRFVDWLTARLQERCYSIFVNSRKVPYTDGGVAIIEAAVRAQLQDGIKAGGLASDPEPTVTVPAVADVSTNDRATRLLPDVDFTATLAGAIHALEITGTVSV